MSDILLRFVEACKATNPVAADVGYLPFTAEFRRETPLNSAPYIFDVAGFRATFGSSDRRRAIIAACDAALDQLRQGGIAWQMLLVGGSFIRSGDTPSDLDALLVYSVDPAMADDANATLARWSKSACFPGVDFKFCPADVHPILLVKRVVFFANLFGYDRETKSLLHGTVLLIPDIIDLPVTGSPAS